jgi:hypothetical protein
LLVNKVAKNIHWAGGEKAAFLTTSAEKTENPHLQD